MFASLIPLGIRLGLVHLVLIWGTNNMTFEKFDSFRHVPPDNVTWDLEEEIRRRENGSRAVLGARVAYVALCVSSFNESSQVN